MDDELAAARAKKTGFCDPCKKIMLTAAETGEPYAIESLCGRCSELLARAADEHRDKYPFLAPMDWRQPVIRVRCHPSRRDWAEATFKGEIVIDDAMAPGTVEVTPLKYEQYIHADIGFVQPPDDKAGG